MTCIDVDNIEAPLQPSQNLLRLALQLSNLFFIAPSAYVVIEKLIQARRKKVDTGYR